MYGTGQNGANSNHNPQIPYNQVQSGYMPQSQQQYQHYNKQNQQQPQPPHVGFGIDDNPYDMGQMAMYQQNPDSEDSSNGDTNNEDAQIDIGSYRADPSPLNMGGGLGAAMPKISNINDNSNNEMLPEIPHINQVPQMLQINDTNLKPQEQELQTHVGFVVKLNARLTQLNAECRTLYPKLSADLVDSKVSQFQSAEYKQLMQSKVLLEQKCREYEQQIQTLLPVQNVNKDLNSELSQLRQNYSANEYVTEIQKQLTVYREKVVYLSNNVQSCMSAIKNSVLHTQKTQESIQDAYNELKPLQEHLSFLEENMNSIDSAKELNASNTEMEQLKAEHTLSVEQLQFKNNALQKELGVIREQTKVVQSEKIANKAQIEEHIEYKYKSQLQALEEKLSRMTVARITMEDDFGQRQKQEQERADKYRAKYESVKQHVKTLEMQKIEYTRVNMQLRQQNNDFRAMITQLQNQLKSVVSMNGMNGMNGPPKPAQNNNELQQLQQQQNMMREQQNLMRQNGQNGQHNNDSHHHSQSYALGVQPPPVHHSHNNHNPLIPQPPNNHQYSNSNPMAVQNGGNGNEAWNNGPMNESVRNIIPSEHSETWGKRTKVISDRGTKKRILVEWHFVTSDAQPHTVVLQHTQDTKPKTRRMLWVDGSEKYNNKSSASSFRIEIDKDVVVVSIDQLDQYQYRLTINNASYADAFKLWEQRQQR